MAEPKRRGRPPATTVEGRENQLKNLATDLAEKQLKNGTASSQVIVHYLKLATQREILEREKLAHENELLKARTEQIASEQKREELFDEAIRAMRAYAPQNAGQDVDH